MEQTQQKITTPEGGVIEIMAPCERVPYIQFCTTTGLPMLEIKGDGFYVRGKKVDQNEKEAEKVFNAFHQWLMLNTLTRNY